MHLQGLELSKQYSSGITVFENVSFDIAPGQSVAIQGPSGCGKSSFLNILGLLDSPSSGQLILSDKRVEYLSPPQRTVFRKDNIGHVFQQYALLEKRTAWENIALARWYQGDTPAQAKKTAMAWLDQLSLQEWAHHLVYQLSGGQKQRLCVARALINRPSLVLADEPTGALDPVNREKVWEMLQQAQQEWGATLILVSHDFTLSQRCTQQWDFKEIA